MKATALPPFQSLFDEHAQAVLAFLIGAVGSSEAEDCFQDTMLSALRAYPRLGDGSNLRGWLFTIARRKVDRRVPGAGAQTDARCRPGSGSPLRPDLRIDEGLWDHVRQLPLKQRKAVVLRFGGDRSYPEIAATMSTTQDSARQSVHEGLKKLRRELR